MNKTKKILSIILISLLIISTVFTLCKKIGLCASSSDTPIVWSGVPFLVGQGIANDGYFTDSFVNTCVDDAITRYGSSTVFIYAYVNGSTDNRTLWICFNNTNSPSTTNQNASANWSTKFSTVYSYTLNGYSNTFSNQSIPMQPYRVFETINGAFYYKRGVYQPNYPIYIQNYGLFTFNNTDTLVFSPVQINNSGGAHTKGGVLGNYIDSSDFLENSSDNPSPDLSNISPSTLSEFWDNLKGFFSRSWNNFNSWMLTIGDLIGEVIDKIQEFNEAALDRLEGFITTTIETMYGWFFDLLDDLLGDIKDDTGDILTDVQGHYQWTQGFFTESGSSNNNFWEYFDEHLGDAIDDLFDNLWDNLPSIMKEPYRIAHWFYQHGLNNNEFDFMTLIHYLFDFDKTTAYNSFSNNKYGDFLLDVKDFSFNFITSLTGVTESDRVFFTISLGEHFGVAIPDIVIDFDWYSQVKNTFLPWLMAFLYVSVVWLFIKRLPDIIKGVAGDISSFEDNLPNNEPFIHDTLSGGVLTHSVTFKHGNSSFTEVSKKNVRW